MKASLGYYLIDGLSFEPELGINLNFEGSTAVKPGNISYTFNTEVRTLFPYLKAGYGVTDVQNYTSPGSGLFESLNYKVISFSLGFKFIQSFHRAIKVELNYKRVSGSDGLLYYYDPYGSAVSPEIETTMSILSISFGYSFTF